MTAILKLPLLMADSPEYWQKFARTFDSSTEMTDALKPWNARPVGLLKYGEIDMDGLKIKFKSEQDLAWFILNWS